MKLLSIDNVFLRKTTLSLLPSRILFQVPEIYFSLLERIKIHFILPHTRVETFFQLVGRPTVGLSASGPAATCNV